PRPCNYAVAGHFFPVIFWVDSTAAGLRPATTPVSRVIRPQSKVSTPSSVPSTGGLRCATATPSRADRSSGRLHSDAWTFVEVAQFAVDAFLASTSVEGVASAVMRPQINAKPRRSALAVTVNL